MASRLDPEHTGGTVLLPLGQQLGADGLGRCADRLGVPSPVTVSAR